MIKMYCAHKNGDCKSLDIAEGKRTEYNQKLRNWTLIPLFKKFDKYSCIKNDKWYLDYKKEIGIID